MFVSPHPKCRSSVSKNLFQVGFQRLNLSEVSSYRNKEAKLVVGIGFSGDSSVAIYGGWVCCLYFLLPTFKKHGCHLCVQKMLI